MKLIEFIAASSLLTLMPGPDILFVVAQSVTQGRRAGISVALGLCSGLFVHTAAAALGISLIIASSPALFAAIRYAGILYLIYMGIASLRGRTASAGVQQAIQAPFGKLYRTGVTMNLLNPKIILFFLAFFPQFLDKASRTPRTDILILGAVFAVVAVVIFTAVALVSDRLSRRFGARAIPPRTLAWIRAVVYWLIAVMFLFY